MFTILSFLLAILFSKTESLACSQQWQCNSTVTTDFNYVDCVSGMCQCKTTSGFSGDATVSNKCRCVAPNKVEWANGAPYCIKPFDRDALIIELANDAYQLSIVQAVYQSLIYPTPAIIMGALIAGQPVPLEAFIAVNATGRVDPLGQFSDQDGIVEYFYGTVWTGAARISKITFKKLTTQNNIVSVNVVLTFDIYDPPQQNILYSYNLTQTGAFTFNSNKLIQSMDLIIHNLGANSDYTTPAYDQNVIGQICFLILEVAKCNSTFDPAGYYTSQADCFNHFMNVYQWGSWDNIYFNGNCTICRYFHTLLAIGRPAMHCSHAGKTGGGKCINHNYATYFNEDF